MADQKLFIIKCPTFPSVIVFTNDRYWTEVKNQKDFKSKNVFYEIKRLIGENIQIIILKLILTYYHMI